jgi:RecA-family ATPase
MTAGSDFSPHMGTVARALLGKPNRQRSNGKELRFRTHGSMAVNLAEGTFFDHEQKIGGGVVDLIKHVKGLNGTAAVAWMRNELGLDVGETKRSNGKANGLGRIVATHDYYDESGKSLFQVVRLEPKDFRQRRRPRGDDDPKTIRDGWVWSVKNVRQVPYRLPELVEAIGQDRIVVIVEGEKDADALAKWNIPATCNAGGAGNWRQELSEFFRNADVVIIPDIDPQAKNHDGTLRFHPDGRPVFAGQDHARDVAGKLSGIAKCIRIFELPGPGKDAADWIAAGGSADEFWRLLETASKAPADYVAPPDSTNSTPANEIRPFETFDASEWEGQPIEPRQWTVMNRIPAGEPGIVSGDGGTGKTQLMNQLGVSVAAELPDWAGGVVEIHGPVIFYSAEEKIKEMHRRIFDVLAQRHLSFFNLKGRLRLICEPEDDVVLGRVERDGVLKPTRTLARLEKTVTLIKPALVIIENAADVFAGSEIDRTTVTRFVRVLLGGLTKPSNASVALIQHPSLSGINDGSGRSGTTGWNNAGRWRLNFTKIKNDEITDDGLRQLEVMKNNYGPQGEKVRLRWDRGVFVPVGIASPMERAAAEARIDTAFIRCLETATAQGRTTSDKPGRNFAPAMFEKMSEAEGAKSHALELAMNRLFSARRITVETIGSPSRQKSQIVRVS